MLESKDDFRARFRKSPDETDACALAALAAKERFGLLPFGYVKAPPSPDSLVRAAGAPSRPAVSVRDDDSYSADAVDADDCAYAVAD